MNLFAFFRKDKDRQEPASTSNSDAYADEPVTKPLKPEHADDPIQLEKKRARRRLVGALALVLGAIIILPMILDTEPQPLSEEIQIHIPPREAAPADKVAEKPLPVSAPADEGIAPAVEKEKKSATPPKSEPSPKPAPATKKTPATPPKRPAADKPDAAAEAARALAILEDKQPPAKKATQAAVSGKGRFTLQVAALSSREKVEELQKKIQATGLKSYTQKITTASGERIRVRVGPFASREQAEKARAKLQETGLGATMVTY